MVYDSVGHNFPLTARIPVFRLCHSIPNVRGRIWVFPRIGAHLYNWAVCILQGINTKQVVGDYPVYTHVRHTYREASCAPKI